jgi:hypothetical protein
MSRGDRLVPAPPRVSTQAIVNALLAWKGEIAQTARVLGMSRNGLYRRLERLGIDARQFRNSDPGGAVSPITTVPMVPTMPTNVRVNHAPPNSGANFPTAARGRRLGSVQQGTAVTVVEPEVVPIKTAPKRQEPIRLKPELRDRLQRAVWQLQARFEEPTNENLILEQLVEETLEEWLRSKLEPAAPGRRKKAAGKNGGGEVAE